MAKAEIDFRDCSLVRERAKDRGTEKEQGGQREKGDANVRLDGIVQTMSSQNTTNLLENARRNVRVSLPRRTFAITPHDNDLH